MHKRHAATCNVGHVVRANPHRHAALMLCLIFIVVASGCLSGQTIKRQAAEVPDNATGATGYENNAPEMEQSECAGSISTCGDGFNATCENEAVDGACTRCAPDCSNHTSCAKPWSCSGWSSCSSGRMSKVCASVCNSTTITETQPCQQDACASEADCPAESGCTRYLCQGSPKQCRPFVVIPCCGDGVCEQAESCHSDCPTTSTKNQTTAPTQPVSVITITNITYKIPESVEIRNTGSVAQSMGGWTLSDNASHVYTFAQFTLHPGASVTVHTGSGTDSAADLFWGRGCVQGSYFGCVWNDG